MRKLPPLPTVAELLRVYGVRAVKDMSQNFLLDTSITDKFVRHAGNLKDRVVIEVGGGPGSLTRSILKAQPRKLYVIEKDARMLPMLNLVADASEGVAEVIHGDAMDIDYDGLIKAADVQFPSTQSSSSPSTPLPSSTSDLHIIGNLPFGIATPLIVEYMRHLSRANTLFSRSRPTMTLCFQKEVGERLCAPPRTKMRSRLSVMTQTYCDVRPAFILPSKAFVPAPKVESMVVSCRPRTTLPSGMEALTFEELEAAVRAGFGSRLRKLRHPLSRELGREGADELVASLDLPVNARPFFLTTDEWVQLALRMREMKQRKRDEQHQQQQVKIGEQQGEQKQQGQREEMTGYDQGHS